jgi:hypothetical protein
MAAMFRRVISFLDHHPDGWIIFAGLLDLIPVVVIVEPIRSTAV